MKKILLFIAVLCCATMLQAETIYGDCGPSMEWEFNTGSGALFLIGTGPMDNYSNTNPEPWKAYKDQIKSIQIDSRSQYTTIGKNAFKDYKALESVDFPNTLDSIGANAFWSCEKLSQVQFPASLRYIGHSAFAYNYQLASLTLPSNLREIGTMTFWHCPLLTSVTIPSNVEKIGGAAFSKCENLTAINADPNNKEFSSQDGVLFSKQQIRIYAVPSGMEGQYTIPSEVMIVEKYAFSYCEKLTNIIFPTSVQYIYSYAFEGCKIQSLELNERLVDIEYSAFVDCSELTTLTLPSTLRSIGNYCFQRCHQLTSITCKATTPPSCSTNTFNEFDRSACTLYVPKGSKATYEATDDWSEFIIVELDDQEGIDQISNEQSPMSNKVLHDGQLLINRGDKTFNAFGAKVK